MDISVGLEGTEKRVTLSVYEDETVKQFLETAADALDVPCEHRSSIDGAGDLDQRFVANPRKRVSSLGWDTDDTLTLSIGYSDISKKSTAAPLKLTHVGKITCLAASPCGKRIYTSCGPKVYSWDARTGQRHRMLTDHTGTVTALSHDTEGKVLCSAAHEIILWDAKRLTPIMTCTARHPVTSIACGAIPGRAYLGGVPGISVAELGKVDMTPIMPVRQLCMPQDGQKLFTLSSKGRVEVWGANLSGQGSLPPVGATCMALSPCQEYVVVGSHCGAPLLEKYSVQSCTKVKCCSLPGVKCSFSEIVISPDGATVYALAADAGLVFALSSKLVPKSVLTLPAGSGKPHLAVIPPSSHLVMSRGSDVVSLSEGDFKPFRPWAQSAVKSSSKAGCIIS